VFQYCVERTRCIEIFEQALKSKVSRQTYKYHLKNFRDWAKIKSFQGLLEAPQKNIQFMLEDYVLYLKKKISPNSVPTYFAPVELFYVMNDVNLNFKKIRKLFPEKVKKANERGYSHDDITKLLSFAKTKRNKALVLLFASSSCRIGSVPEMRLRHLQRIEGSYAIMIYEDSIKEDFVFTTPEATRAIDDYLDERRKDGEYVDGESPLFRAVYKLGIEKVKPCTVDSLAHVTRRLVRIIARQKSKNGRYNIAQNHGFRKLFATAIKNTVGISSTMTEKLINHVGVTQLDGTYFAPSVEEMFEAYKKVIPKLVFNETERLRIENLSKQEEINKLKSKDVEILELKSRLDGIEKLLHNTSE